MRFLLDTHVLLWITGDPERIPIGLIATLEHADSKTFVSVASIWEVAIKIGQGKIRLSVEELLEELKKQPFEILPIEVRHVQGLTGLAPFHKDPFDRLLISQALTDDLVLVSVDRQFSQYGVRLFWQ